MVLTLQYSITSFSLFYTHFSSLHIPSGLVVVTSFLVPYFLFFVINSVECFAPSQVVSVWSFGLWISSNTKSNSVSRKYSAQDSYQSRQFICRVKRMFVALSCLLPTIGRQKSARKHTLPNSAVWPVPYACAQQYQPSSGNHGQLLRPSLGLISMA